MYRVIDAVADLFTSSKTKEARWRAAGRFVDRVQAVIKAEGEEGCSDVRLACSFEYDEIRLANCTLDQLVDRGLIRKEIRYFLSDE